MSTFRSVSQGAFLPDETSRALTKERQIDHWLRVLRGAERQLDVAQRRSDVDYAASRLMNAKLELKRLGVDWRPRLMALPEQPLLTASPATSVVFRYARP
jgi:hypothetical protein